MSLQIEELQAKLNIVAKKKSLEIEKYLSEDKGIDHGAIKILILGGPSSGKSTIFKQMRIIHSNGFTRPDELESFKSLIFCNIRSIFTQLVNGANHLSVCIDSIQELIISINETYAQLDADSYQYSAEGRMSQKLGEMLKKFWKSQPIQTVFGRRYEIETMDSTKYFLENIERISTADYMPNLEDIVHSRRPTTTINNLVFTYTSLKLNMVDVGGQRSERRKWMHLFDDARVVMFVVDLTGYAKKSEESRADIARFTLFSDWRNHADKIPDMKVAMKIFQDVVTNKVLQNAVYLIFFNKVDLFDELLPHVHLKTCFTKFDGENNFEETTQYIQDKFLKSVKTRRSIFPHLTTATNTENIKIVFRACMESVFKANSQATGLA
ncbi:unnamed protein product [Caenorhabditis bovis]|uniref:Uncharacterized protein n=1 Tax=Caenorhabditis bovis TaxID=2654633 RepID=A0A8S1F993_9PELO|nr:unnamed protein product [Caenorhabditis bovis]